MHARSEATRVASFGVTLPLEPCHMNHQTKVVAPVIVLLTVLAASVHPSADEPVPPVCRSSDLTVNGGTAMYRLSSELQVKVTGGCLAQLRETLGTGAVDTIVLYLNDVEMKGVKGQPVVLDDPQKNEGLLTFRLKRNGSDETSRSAWDQFLGAEDHAGFEMRPALKIGNAPVAIPVSVKGLTFGVAEQRAIVLSAVGGLAVFLALFYAMAKKGLLQDVTARYSLGKAQFAFWALLVFLSVVILSFFTGTLEFIPKSILALLGISTATTAIAKAIDAGKAKRIAEVTEEEKALNASRAVSSDPLETAGKETRLALMKAELTQKTKLREPPNHKPRFFRDICSDADGLSIHRLQAVAWTALLGVVFVVSITRQISMPVFEDNLLLLMGVSSAGYLALKPNERTERPTPAPS